MNVREVNTEDYEKWLSLWEQYNTFYKRKIPIDVTETTWKRFFDPNEPVQSLVAEEKGEILGLTNYLFHRNTAMKSEVCYLQDLFTVETSRGRGIGESLISAVRQRAKSRGCLQVYWMTHESNGVARGLYEKMAKHAGFIVYSCRTD